MQSNQDLILIPLRICVSALNLALILQGGNLS
jgi:hypothetical protein